MAMMAMMAMDEENINDGGGKSWLMPLEEKKIAELLSARVRAHATVASTRVLTLTSVVGVAGGGCCVCSRACDHDVEYAQVGSMMMICHAVMPWDRESGLWNVGFVCVCV